MAYLEFSKGLSLSASGRTMESDLGERMQYRKQREA